MKNETELADIRRAYAQQILSLAGVNSAELEDAFAAVKREHYLGPGPWNILRQSGYEETRDGDPTPLYDNVLVGIIPERGLNNGQPSAHAMWLVAAGPAGLDVPYRTPRRRIPRQRCIRRRLHSRRGPA